jgi:glucose/arabinose dehydrogenase
MANFKGLKEFGQRVARLTAVRKGCYRIAAMLLTCLLVILIDNEAIEAQPTLVDPRLEVRTVVSGLSSPTTMAFLGDNDILVLEKETGRVRRVMNGAIQSTVLDLPVNFGSERGLLGIALHPEFPINPGVYLFWTESTTGNDTSVLSATPLLGNRVDRFTWDGSSLTFDGNIIRLRAIQQDADQPERGNHDGGMLRFGPDGKLYIFYGDQGRRGQLQNLPDGPFGPGQPDDQFGGPEPDNAHLSGVVLRLNDDGTAPDDNPFFKFGASLGGEVGANIQKIFSYGHRNSFGMAFDPFSGKLWLQENGDDSFSELNLVEPGMNGGWVQIAGPVERIAQFKAIETSNAIDPITMSAYFGLQQVRWPPTLIADTPAEALSRLFMLPGAHYSDPKLSWKFEVAPAGIGFLDSVALGPRYEGDLFLGEARTFLNEGYVFRLRLNRTRREIDVRDSALEDTVADNLNKFDITESETLLFGRGFGVGTDIQTGPNGNLFVVSLSNGAIYEIFHFQRR